MVSSCLWRAMHLTIWCVVGGLSSWQCRGATEAPHRHCQEEPRTGHRDVLEQLAELLVRSRPCVRQAVCSCPRAWDLEVVHSYYMLPRSLQILVPYSLKPRCRIKCPEFVCVGVLTRQRCNHRRFVVFVLTENSNMYSRASSWATCGVSA